MTIKNNDDVAHLLDATGRTGTPCREFESSSDQMSAPLIDAIFGKAPRNPDREEMPLGIGSGPSNDLLADVFDSPPGNRAPGSAGARPADRGEWRDQPARQQHSGAAIRPPAPAPSGPQRSLSDIRRIITQPAGPAAQSPSSNNLNGLFERLAG